MNENNALSQLMLVKDLNDHRRIQISALEKAINRLEKTCTDKKARAYFLTALFLTHMAEQLASSIGSEISVTVGEMKRMLELPDNEQWEYRIARTLGTVEGLNAVGSILSRIIEKTQTFLHNAALLEMTADKTLCLQAHVKGTPDHLHAIAEEANANCARFKNMWLMASQLTATLITESQKREENSAFTIASISSCACDSTMAFQLAGLNNVAGQAFDEETLAIAVKDKKKSEEYKTAQITASAVVSGLISALVQKNVPWLAVNLN